MLKDLKIVLAFVLAFTLSSTVYVRAEENNEGHSVSTFVELKAAADQKVASITLENDIIVEEPILFLNDVVIEGNNHTLKVNKTKTEWESLYILKFHRVNATLSNVQLDGGDAALLVNNSRLTLNGSITLRNQAFGGIELTHGKTAQKDPVSLSTLNATLTNESEEKGKPTVWSDLIDTYQIDDEHFIKRDDLVENQNHYYLADPDAVVPVTVTTYEQFKEALANKSEHIILGADLEFIEKVNVTYPVIIDGNNHTISGVNTEGWTGFYLLQFYKTEAVLSNITLTNADAGILVNGSSLTLLGDVDLSGNEFGGIELSKGKDVTNNVVLDVTNAVLTNDTEDYGLPTVWIDNTLDAEVIGGTFVVRKDIKASQVQYYLNAETNKEAKANEMFYEMFAALNSDKIKVNVNETDGSLQVVLIDATVDVDAVVDVLTSIIVDNDEVVGFQIAGAGAGFSEKPSEEDIRATIENLVTLYLSSTRTAVAAEGRAIPFGLIVKVDGTDVETDVVNVSFTSRNGTVDPVEPTKPTEDKETPKTDGAKTPNTGLSDMMTMYASLIVLGAIVLVTLKTKKRYN